MLPLSVVLKSLFIFINAHLALNHANTVAVLASHVDRVQMLYPTPLGDTPPPPETNGTAESTAPKPANKYRPFLTVETELRKNIRSLLSTAPTTHPLSSPPLLSSALSMALTYANMQALLSQPTSSGLNTSDALAAGTGDLDTHTNAVRSAASGPSLVSRILVFSVSPADLSGQYIALMNSVFAAQRLNVPIDMLRLGARASFLQQAAFLQQASDATGGVFMNYDPQATGATNGEPNGATTQRRVDENAAAAGLLQTLLLAYLPDVTARRHLVPSGSAEVDFRAACFCHGKVVSSGGVCSVCLGSKLFFFT